MIFKEEMSMLIFAHRGASKAAPENTVKAFKLAFEQRADGGPNFSGWREIDF